MLRILCRLPRLTRNTTRKEIEKEKSEQSFFLSRKLFRCDELFE